MYRTALFRRAREIGDKRRRTQAPPHGDAFAPVPSANRCRLKFRAAGRRGEPRRWCSGQPTVNASGRIQHSPIVLRYALLALRGILQREWRILDSDVNRDLYRVLYPTYAPHGEHPLRYPDSSCMHAPEHLSEKGGRVEGWKDGGLPLMHADKGTSTEFTRLALSSNSSRGTTIMFWSGKNGNIHSPV